MVPDRESRARGKRLPQGEPVIDRALSLLSAFDASQRRLSPTELSRRSGIPVSSTLRLAGHLLRWGALERDGRGATASGCGEGNGVEDALLEIRQPDAAGVVPVVPGSRRRDGAPFTGWGRTATDPTGHFWFHTVEPGPSRPGGAPFFAVAVFARGLLNRLFTRIYLPAGAAVFDTDPLLATLDAAERRAMVAAREADGSLRFDVHLQGPLETPFLTYPRHR